ncbi:MAG: hypothetical protein PPP55_09160 [Halorubrum sp.]
MSSRDAELVIETWQFRDRALPRVPPSGWATTDRLREAVCLAVACAVDGVEHVEPFEGPATERERFDATVTTDSVDDDHVRLVTPVSAAASEATESDADESGAPDESRAEFSETTEQFDLAEALDRL